MQIKFIAQSGFIIDIDNSKRICIDLWLQNPVHPIKLADVPKMDYVFITHDHGDHDMKSGIEIAKRDNATLYANNDILTLATNEGVQKVERMAIGGLIKSGNIEVAQVQAFHTSNTGIPVGFIIKTGSHVIYHMGDTGYFSTLKEIREIYKPDILMIPIGSRYTMGPLEASFAVRDIKPKYVIPMHYNTSSAIQQDPEEFKKLVLDKVSVEVIIMKPGEGVNF
jgi:L-ascorbate metabolism protein UlaG (beta-lactamase superfamily)